MVEGFSGGVGGEAQDLAARDLRQARGAVDEEEAQGPHAGDAVGVCALARVGLEGSQSKCPQGSFGSFPLRGYRASERESFQHINSRGLTTLFTIARRS